MIPCPVWQCGGTMEAVEREAPKGINPDDGYNGDWQTPDLVCDNCGAVYQFVKFTEHAKKR